MLNFQKFGCFETLILFVKCNIQRNHLLRKYNQKYSKIFKNVQNIDFIDCLAKVVRNEQVVNSLLWIIPEKCFCIKVKLVALRFLTLLISHRSNVSFNLKILSMSVFKNRIPAMSFKFRIEEKIKVTCNKLWERLFRVLPF